MARARALSKMDFNTFTIEIQPKNKTIIADVLISSRPSVSRVPSYMGKCTQIYIPRDLLSGAARASFKVSGTSWKLRAKDMTTYHEHLASYLKMSSQRIRNVLQVT